MDSPPAVRATRSRRPTAKAASALEEQVSKPRRRTKAEKARDDKAEETRKKRENEMKQGSIEQVAQLEENMELVDAGAMSAHPRHRDGEFRTSSFFEMTLLIEHNQILIKKEPSLLTGRSNQNREEKGRRLQQLDHVNLVCLIWRHEKNLLT